MSGRRVLWAAVFIGSWAALAGAEPVGTTPASEACPASIVEAPLEVRPPERWRVRLAWRDLSRGLGPVSAAVQEEVARIFAPLDVAVDWRVAVPEELAGEDEISIIVLPRPRGALPAHVMGAVNRTTKREAWIFVEGLRRRLARPAGPTAVPVDPRDFARLAGRVIAHEIVHVIAPELGHTRGGLMRAEWSHALAVQPRLDLDARAARAFLTALDPAVAFCPPRPDDAAEIAGEAVPGDPVDLL
jgi:hypothetical protein